MKGSIKMEDVELVEQFIELLQDLSAEEMETVKAYIKELLNQ